MATTTLTTVAGPPRSIKLTTGDPLNVNARLYHQISELLVQLEHDENVTMRERIAALVAIARIQTIFVALRKEKNDDSATGKSIKKYTSVFKDGSGRRKKVTGPSPEPEPDIADLIGIRDDDEYAN